MTPLKALFDGALSDEIAANKGMNLEKAVRLFRFFQTCSLFRWSDARNDCEDRANAICLLLDKWGLPVYKGWVFGGSFLKKDAGTLQNCWNYHVAAALPVVQEGRIEIYIIDPATSDQLITIGRWATQVTDEPNSYYIVRKKEDYIFNQSGVNASNWYANNRQNYKWTIQGLAGINGVTAKGKAELVFNKKRIITAEARFKELMKRKPF